MVVEKFFIERPVFTGRMTERTDMMPPMLVYADSEGQELKWSATFALPEIGQRIYVTMNGIGYAEVKGYFSSDGYVGVMTLAENPPKWLVKQNARDRNDASKPRWYRDGIGCEYGVEISLDKPVPVVTY